MIEIITPGHNKYRAFCPICQCIFTYEIPDLNQNKAVPCPMCDTEVAHSKSFPYKKKNNKKEVQNGN